MAVFGGTFDPPHLGHLVVASELIDRLGVDEVRLVVANEPWQKVGSRPITPAADRLRLTRLAAGDLDGVTVSDVELRRGGSSYSIDTLEAFAAEEPDTRWLLVVGADAAAGLDTWHRADDLRALAEVVVVNRGGDERDTPAGWRRTRLDIPALEISSTDLRRRRAEGRTMRLLTPDPVITEIERLGLYLSEA